MYCDFFGIRQRPFEDRADTRFFHATSGGEEALAMMEYECHFGKGTALLLGDAGTGKTLHIRMLLQQLHATDHVVVLSWPSSGQSDLIRESIKGFGLTLPTNMTASRGVARLKRHLMNTAKAEHRSILIVDQAENLTQDNLAELATLADLQRDGQRLLNIVLSAQPQFKEALESPDVARVRQQLFGERVLSAFTPEETVAYILHRLDAAGVVDQEIFEPDALRLIYERSNGVARLVNHICNASMLAAYGAEQQVVTESIVEEVTSRGTQEERSLSASELGLSSNGQVANGWTEPAGSAPAATGNTPSAEQTDTILARLESVLDRAHRSDGHPQKYTESHAKIENHLHSLIQEAYRVAGSLREASDSAIQCSQDVEDRFDRARTQSEKQVDEFDQQLIQATEIAQRTQDCLDGIAEACTDTDEVRTQLSAFAQELSSKADEVQSRIANLVQGMEMSEAAADRLQNLLNHEAALTSRADKRTEEIRLRIEQGFAEAQQRQSQSVDAAIEQSQKRFEALIVAHQSRLEKTFDKLQANMAEQEREIESLQTKQSSLTDDQRRQFDQFLDHETQVVERTMDGHRQNVAKMLDQSEERFRALESLIDASREKSEVTLVVCQNAFTDATKNFDSAIESQEHAVRDIQDRQRALTQSNQLLNSDLKTMEQSSAQMTRSLHDIESSIGALTTRAEQTVAGLSSLVPGGEHLLQEVQSATGTLDALQRNVATTLVDLGSAAERYRALTEQVHGAEEIAGRLASERDASHSAIAELHSAAAAVHVDVETARELLAQTTTRVRQLEEQNAIAVDAVENIRDVAMHGDGLVDKLGTINAQADTLIEQNQLAQATSKTLDELIDCASALNETFQGTIAHSDEKIGQLSSHHAAATHILGQLNEVTQSGHALIDTMDQRTVDATQAKEWLTQSLTQAGNLTQSCASIVGELTQRSQLAQEVTNEASAITENAQSTLQDLTQQVEAAKIIKVNVASAEEILVQANKSQSAIIESTREADLVRENLVNTTKTAAQARLKLEDQTNTTSRVVEDCDRARGEADHSAGRLASQVDIAQRSFEGRESLLTDFVERSHSVEQQLTELQSAADKIDQQITELTARPTEVFTQAREQAEQLEKVCKAVRKVFASLSHATLEAHQQTEESKRAGQEAISKTRELVERITSESQQCADTLREWVAEADTVQARLERMVEQCPTIQQTHAVHKSRRMSSTSTSRTSKISTRPSGELEVLTEPRLGQVPDSAVPSKGPSRAQEIANLLAEAQQASLDTTGR